MIRKTTPYYRNTARHEHSEVPEEVAWDIIDDPDHVEVQDDGRVRYYGEVTFRGGSVTMYARVVTLADGETLHNAFPDKHFTKRMRRQLN